MHNELYRMCELAFELNEIPISCLIRNIKTGQEKYFINNKERSNKITGHAEILAIDWASSISKDFRLSDYEMIISTEPCIMCAGAIVESRVSSITILSLKDNSKLYLLDEYFKKSNTEFYYSLDNKFSDIIKNFFKNKRNMI